VRGERRQYELGMEGGGGCWAKLYFIRTCKGEFKKGDENTHIICIKNKVLCDVTPFGLVKSGFSETLVNTLCTNYVALTQTKIISVTVSNLMLLADEFVEFCIPRRNDKYAGGPKHSLHSLGQGSL